ncbi:predicted protein [Nematostella vectensis]|uniref:Acyl-coenzyme A oxidase n=1 Tax=Nematostella vectensis TaxID=45351 RepID=A7SJ50_NEMVE|nr:predicted protein [Nematostella vectensis]|eukprot:XP_001628342.1 predicted protein [Nematostella vectensis]
MNPDIARERSKASFDIQELTYFLDGGKEKTSRRRYLESLLSNDPVFEKDQDWFYGREGSYENSLRKGVHFIDIVRTHKITDKYELQVLERAIGYPLPTLLNDLMFIPTIKTLGTKRQQEKWIPLAKSYQILGTYAQTEMGHGTFIRAIETTATYDTTTQEFVLHSPSLTAAKWWPGSLGHTCSHAIVLAQLYIGKKSYGIQFFMLQIRDPVTRRPTPGVKLGDIGPKGSFLINSQENGYLLLDHVRVPRDHMLSALAEVMADGTFVKSSNEDADKVLYSIMLYVRSTIPQDAYFIASRAITIAVRYSAVRRQSELKPGQGELQILDYSTQQDKLLPSLATAYAYKFASDRIRIEYERANTKWTTGDFSNLPELHVLTSAMKAYTTSGARLLADTCRLGCGGHGFSMFSLLTELFAVASAACTYEGENTVLYLQVARFLLKCVSKARLEPRLPPSVSYLLDESTRDWRCTCSSPRQLDSQTQLRIYKARASRLINMTADKMQADVILGMDPVDSWNKNSVDLVRCAKAHSSYLIVQFFLDALSQSNSSREIASVLKSQSDLYALYGIVEDSGSFMECGVLTVNQIAMIRDQVYSLYQIIRPDAVALVDAFDYSDFVLNSALGRYDGQVYQRLFELAQKSPLNKSPVQPSAKKYLPQLHKSKL